MNIHFPVPDYKNMLTHGLPEFEPHHSLGEQKYSNLGLAHGISSYTPGRKDLES